MGFSRGCGNSSNTNQKLFNKLENFEYGQRHVVFLHVVFKKSVKSSKEIKNTLMMFTKRSYTSSISVNLLHKQPKL